MRRRRKLRIKNENKRVEKKKMRTCNAKWQSGHEWLVFDPEKT